MPKGPRGEKRPADVIGNAVLIGKIATGEEKEALPKLSGRIRSGKAGARARNERLTSAERSEIARTAANERWR